MSSAILFGIQILPMMFHSIDEYSNIPIAKLKERQALAWVPHQLSF